MPRLKRTKTEQIEDLFADLGLTQQEQCLLDLAKLQRWCRKLRAPAELNVTNGQLQIQIERDAK